MSSVLVVDVGGSHVKVLATGEHESRRADSGPDFTAAQMVEAALSLAADWTWAVAKLSAALEPDYVVLGGGNAKKLDALPPNARLGANENAFTGGFRLWDPNALAQIVT